MKTKMLSCLFAAFLMTNASIVSAQTNLVPITAIQSVSSTSNVAASISDFSCNVKAEKMFLNWNVKENQVADRLIVQRSKNGKKFVMIGLVFGTDRAGTEAYQFFEKVKSKKAIYRVIIVHKDQTIEYSNLASASTELKTKTSNDLSWRE
jgi:hypothetical protein